MAGFRRKLAVFYPFRDKNREKPEKTCGNRTNPVDKSLRKDEGELRYGFFGPA
jgi:hypothetical protein